MAHPVSDYEWIVVAGAIGSFFAAFGIGANDVANAFATSVGSRALTVKQACVLATVFEVSGAILMGSHVTGTIRKSIADIDCFVDEPAVLMYGCLCVIFSVGGWLLLASYLEMPVSTTHSCVGGMIGMAMVAHGPACVIWAEPTDQFPYVKGVSAIVISWFLSPLLSAISAMGLFLLVRTTVLRAKDSYDRAFKVYPLLVGVTIFINAFFIIYKGAKGLGLNKTPLEMALGISLAISAVSALLTTPLSRLIRASIDATHSTDAPAAAAAGVKELVTKGQMRSDELDVSKTMPPMSRLAEAGGQISRRLSTSIDVDPHASIQDNSVVGDMHAQAEVFDPKAEAVFRYLQIFTACCDSFAHGANDVANSIGPFAAIYAIHATGEVSSKSDMGVAGYWILALGGLGIATGLLLYGYKIMAALGVKIAKITPARGFAIELGAALIIIIGSRLGWPLSTTHCQVGATTGVALLEGKGGVNKYILVKTAVGWVITLVVVGCTAALLFAWGIHTPEQHLA
uniref:Phosphate transporter n=2 Tax=Coccolithus braarudii TaxID=221442 RepID=A0A7S0QA31_9EUKA|mmetsp:Transcript_51705/g.110459  ORF Transcript_51705/g.110459 Transcript_51705/m.110459 type:complete len:513 (+) Transcript_51705:48-1586(+)